MAGSWAVPEGKDHSVALGIVCPDISSLTFDFVLDLCSLCAPELHYSDGYHFLASDHLLGTFGKRKYVLLGRAFLV